MINKGPKSAECVKYVRNMGAKCVMGNHDEIAKDFYQENKELILNKSDKKPKFKKPVEEELFDKLTLEEWEWLVNLPYFIRIEELKVLLVHAGVIEIPPEETPGTILCEMRDILPNGFPSKYINHHGSKRWAAVSFHLTFFWLLNVSLTSSLFSRITMESMASSSLDTMQ